MKVRELWTRDRAVSPVVGVALMIAIAVILAAIIGIVVLDLGTSSADGPQASLSFEGNSSDLTVHHRSGDPLHQDNIVLRGSAVDGTEQAFPGNLSAGESLDIHNEVNSGGEVNVVWVSPDNGDETVVASTELED